MCYLLKRGHWGTIWLLTFWTMLNDEIEVFLIAVFQHCLKIQWEEWQSIEPRMLGILWVLILNAVHKFIFYKFFKGWIKQTTFLQLCFMKFCFPFSVASKYSTKQLKGCTPQSCFSFLFYQWGYMFMLRMLLWSL